MAIRESIIPGLPDDVARECLARLPYSSLPSARAAASLWSLTIDSPHHRRLRRSRRLLRPLLLLAQSPTSPSPSPSSSHKLPSSSIPHSYRLSLHDPQSSLWSSLPSPPSLPHGLPLFCRLAAAARHLAVVGGWDPDAWTPSPDIHIYSFATGTWRRGAPMPGPKRSFFACAAAEAADGAAVVVVAGGHDGEKNALRSAMAYSVARDEWAPMPDMASERDECHGVFLRGGGRFRVVGGYPTDAQGRFCGTAEAFDVDTWRWGPVEEGAVGPEGAACVAGEGGTYACSGGRVAVSDGDTWRDVAGVPADVAVAPQMVGWEGGLMVIGSGRHGGAVGAYVLRVGHGKVPTWQRVEVPEEYSGHVQAVCCLEI